MEIIQNREYKKEKMKEMLMKLQSGQDPEELKQEFKALLKSISPLEIPIIEQELVKEGVKPREIAKMCDIHVELFRETVSGASEEEEEGLPRGHPLDIFYRENKEIIKDAELLGLYASSLPTTSDEKTRADLMDVLDDIAGRIMKIGFTHYNCEEMLLFPYIERLGISAVPTVLWTKHDEIRIKMKQFSGLLKAYEGADWSDFSAQVKEKGAELSRKLVDMVFREDNILYPTARILLPEGAWVAIKEQSDEYGYYGVKPEVWKVDAAQILPHEIMEGLSAEDILSLPPDVQRLVKATGTEKDDHVLVRNGDVDMGTGFMLPAEMIRIFSRLPVDITFIDRDDRVRFFSGGERIFPRSKNILGRRVQMCHPPKSVHIVNRILADFRAGKRDNAEFWIQMGPRFIHITYYPLWDDNGEYMGTLEVSQDATHVRSLEGEKRLLDY